jgi:hypothetical protein
MPNPRMSLSSDQLIPFNKVVDTKEYLGKGLQEGKEERDKNKS